MKLLGKFVRDSFHLCETSCEVPSEILVHLYVASCEVPSEILVHLYVASCEVPAEILVHLYVASCEVRPEILVHLVCRFLRSSHASKILCPSLCRFLRSLRPRIILSISSRFLLPKLHRTERISLSISYVPLSWRIVSSSMPNPCLSVAPKQPGTSYFFSQAMASSMQILVLEAVLFTNPAYSVLFRLISRVSPAMNLISIRSEDSALTDPLHPNLLLKFHPQIPELQEGNSFMARATVTEIGYLPAEQAFTAQLPSIPRLAIQHRQKLSVYPTDCLLNRSELHPQQIIYTWFHYQTVRSAAENLWLDFGDSTRCDESFNAVVDSPVATPRKTGQRPPQQILALPRPPCLYLDRRCSQGHHQTSNIPLRADQSSGITVGSAPGWSPHGITHRRQNLSRISPYSKSAQIRFQENTNDPRPELRPPEKPHPPCLRPPPPLFFHPLPPSPLIHPGKPISRSNLNALFSDLTRVWTGCDAETHRRNRNGVIQYFLCSFLTFSPLSTARATGARQLRFLLSLHRQGDVHLTRNSW
ncbi:hypothetical protein C7M84_000198 [Penaeus vannamei]|uniref:Uncharacterized protein n=1 Tax=Penaeus vannamei TaxID=6689 RepID=A0A423TX59_PENVA|nr:hypothetical protein C7M84_000198 [Penaeus vannamei]